MKKIRWFAVALWMIVIFAFSHQAYSGRETEKYLGDANVPVRKAGHISEYMILYWLIRWALQKEERDHLTVGDNLETDTTDGALAKSRKAQVLRVAPSPGMVAFLIALAYAISDEWHQSYVPGRSATLTDVSWDTCGIALGMVLLFAISHVQKSKTPRSEL